jgi:hypothetical protein
MSTTPSIATATVNVYTSPPEPGTSVSDVPRPRGVPDTSTVAAVGRYGGDENVATNGRSVALLAKYSVAPEMFAYMRSLRTLNSSMLDSKHGLNDGSRTFPSGTRTVTRWLAGLVTLNVQR